MKTYITCTHYGKDPLLGDEHCVRTAFTETEISLTDGKTREKVQYVYCDVERMGSA